MLFLLGKFSAEVFSVPKIANDFQLLPLSLALEFRLDSLALSILFAVILLKTIILFYYQPDIKKFLDERNSKIFYSVFLLNLFTLTGLLTTNNLFNLFLFLEIYACSFFAIFSIAKDQKITQLSFRYFCFNSAASLLMLLCFIVIYLIFGSLNLDVIQENLSNTKDLRFFVILAILLAIGLIIKFFPFWLYFENLKNTNLFVNFFAIDSLFIKANLGIFFAIKFSYLFFSNPETSAILVCAAICLIFYSLFQLLKTKHFKLIAIYLCLINFGFIFICLALHREKSMIAAFFYWLNFNLVNFFLFIFATFLKRKFNTSLIEKIVLIAPHNHFAGNQLLVLPLKFLIIFIAAFPFSFLFYGNWYLFLEGLKFDLGIISAIITATIVVSNIALAVFAVKIATITFATPRDNQEKLVLEPRKYWFYVVSFWSVIILIYAFWFAAGFLNKVAGLWL